MMLLAFSFGVAAKETITIRAWTVRPDTPAFHRPGELGYCRRAPQSDAGSRCADIRVEVDADFWTDDWDSFRRRVILA